MFSLAFLVLISISVCSGQFLNCGWVKTLDCSKYPGTPDCGTDGVTYGNRCYFANAQCQNKNLHIQNEGACVGQPATTKPTTAKSTTTSMKPMTDQSTMSTKPAVVVVTIPSGPTTTRAPIFLGHNAVLDFFCLELSHEDCPKDTEQVCGTDGKTYDNFCEYEKARCAHRALMVDHYGGC